MKRRLTRSISALTALTAMALTCALWAPSSCWATRIKAEAMTLDYQVRKSDAIVRGTVEESVTKWTNRHIFTTYKIKVKKYLKAPTKTFAEGNKVLTVTQLGGRVSAPLPLEENYPNRASIFTGEEVVLFLLAPSSVPASVRARHDKFVGQGIMEPSPMMRNFTLTTLNISKLTVVKDPRTGKELVTRINLARPGLMASDEIAKQAVEAFEAGEKTVVVRFGERAYRVPIEVGKLMIEPDSIEGAEKSVPTMRRKIARMRAFSSTWGNFESEVASILKAESESAAEGDRSAK